MVKSQQSKNITALIIAFCMLVHLVIAVALRLIYSSRPDAGVSNTIISLYCVVALLYTLGIVYFVTLFFQNKKKNAQNNQVRIAFKIIFGIIVGIISYVFWLFTALFSDGLSLNLGMVLLVFYSSIHLAVCIILFFDFISALNQKKLKVKENHEIKRNLVFKALILASPTVASLVIAGIYLVIDVTVYSLLVLFLLPVLISSVLSLIFYVIAVKKQSKRLSGLLCAVLSIANYLSASLYLSFIGTFLWLFNWPTLIIAIINIILNLSIIAWLIYQRNIEKIKTLEDFKNETN